MEDTNHLYTSINGSMSSDLVKHYKHENTKFRAPKQRKTKHYFVTKKETKATKAKKDKK